MRLRAIYKRSSNFLSEDEYTDLEDDDRFEDDHEQYVSEGAIIYDPDGQNICNVYYMTYGTYEIWWNANTDIARKMMATRLAANLEVYPEEYDSFSELIDRLEPLKKYIVDTAISDKLKNIRALDEYIKVEKDERTLMFMINKVTDKYNEVEKLETASTAAALLSIMR